MTLERRYNRGSWYWESQRREWGVYYYDTLYMCLNSRRVSKINKKFRIILQRGKQYHTLKGLAWHKKLAYQRPNE